jgi:hypothetical protein
LAFPVRPAAGKKRATPPHFDSLGTIYVINEEDGAAKSLLAKLKVSAIRERVRVVNLDGAKDPSELYCNDRARFRDCFEAALREAGTVPLVPLYQREGGGSERNYPATLDQPSFGRLPVRSSRESYNAYQRELMRNRRAAKHRSSTSNSSNTVFSSNGGSSPRYNGTAGTNPDRDAILKRIAELRPFDEEGARAIIADVVKLGFSGLMVETLIRPLADALGVKDAAIRKFWKEVEAQVRAAAAAEASKTNHEAIAKERAGSKRKTPSGGNTSLRNRMIGCGARAKTLRKVPRCSQI